MKADIPAVVTRRLGGRATFSQTRNRRSPHERIELRWGKLCPTSLAFAVPPSIDCGTVCARIDGREFANIEAGRQGQRSIIGLGDQVTLNAGNTLVVERGPWQEGQAAAGAPSAVE